MLAVLGVRDAGHGAPILRFSAHRRPCRQGSTTGGSLNRFRSTVDKFIEAGSYHELPGTTLTAQRPACWGPITLSPLRVHGRNGSLNLSKEDTKAVEKTIELELPT